MERADAPAESEAARCPLCEASATRPFPIRYSFHGRTYRGHECRDCGFIFVAPRPSPAELDLMYGEEYFTAEGADAGAHSATDYETAAIAGSVKFPEILGWIRRYRPEGDFLEIGCGMGYFLDFARRHGYRVSGIEYSEFGTAAARRKFNLDVQRGSLDTVKLDPNAYDVVFLGDVLEHMVEPLGELRRIRALLKPGGVVAIEVPAQFNALVGRGAVTLYRWLGREREMGLPPYHLNEFRPRTLRRMLAAAGYDPIRVVERIKPPGTITLRGSRFDRLAKRWLQYPNYWLTRTLHRLGDRLFAIGVRP